MKRHTRQADSLPHLQPKKRAGALKRGHVFLGDPINPRFLLLAAAGAGALLGESVEAATGSELLGHAAGLGVDFLNPAADVQAVEGLLETIGTDIIGGLYDVELEPEIELIEDLDQERDFE